jgi:2-methylaconitate isomerase
MEQTTVPCVIMRGGTSKGLYFHVGDLPPEGLERDRVLKRLMGSPDILQIDGLGGSRPVTSKVAIIGVSDRDDADVDYTFGQVDIERDLIGYVGNCGNISAGVGPFAIDEHLIEATQPYTTVRIYNTNTDKVLRAKVPVREGKAQVTGDCVVAGVPGAGAAIVMDYSGTVGAVSGKLLPTGRVVDAITLEDGRQLDATLCDVANPCVFIAAADLGLTGDELPDELSADPALMTTIGEIQSKTGQMYGLWPNWQDVSMPGFPLVVLVAPPAAYTDAAGAKHEEPSMDLRARLLFVNRCHDSMAGTGATCLAAATRVPGSVAQRVLTGDCVSSTLRIGHPLGVMEVLVSVDPDSQGDDIQFTTLGFARTARRLMAGQAYLPVETP